MNLPPSCLHSFLHHKSPAPIYIYIYVKIKPSAPIHLGALPALAFQQRFPSHNLFRALAAFGTGKTLQALLDGLPEVCTHARTHTPGLLWRDGINRHMHGLLRADMRSFLTARHRRHRWSGWP